MKERALLKVCAKEMCECEEFVETPEKSGATLSYFFPAACKANIH